MLQDEAGQVCSLPYRAPELFDVSSKTTIDEKAEATLVEIVKRYKLTSDELADVGKAIKEVGNQLGHVPKAVAGKTRKRASKKVK